MGKNHLIRINAPKIWGFKRKENKYAVRPMPGPHPIKKCVTLTFILRDMLEQAKTMKEIKKVLTDGSITIDKKIVKETKYPVGLMDVVEIPKLDEHYRMVLGKDGELILIGIDKKESNLKLLKVVNKTMIKKGKLQVTFHDGRNILLSKSECNIGDTALFDLTTKKIDKWMHLDKGSLVYLSDGSHVGELGKIIDIIKARNLEKPKVVVEIEGKNYITLAGYSFVVGKDKPEIKLGDKK